MTSKKEDFTVWANGNRYGVYYGQYSEGPAGGFKHVIISQVPDGALVHDAKKDNVQVEYSPADPTPDFYDRTDANPDLLQYYYKEHKPIPPITDLPEIFKNIKDTKSPLVVNQDILRLLDRPDVGVNLSDGNEIIFPFAALTGIRVDAKHNTLVMHLHGPEGERVKPTRIPLKRISQVSLISK